MFRGVLDQERVKKLEEYMVLQFHKRGVSKTYTKSKTGLPRQDYERTDQGTTVSPESSFKWRDIRKGPMEDI